MREPTPLERPNAIQSSLTPPGRCQKTQKTPKLESNQLPKLPFPGQNVSNAVTENSRAVCTNPVSTSITLHNKRSTLPYISILQLLPTSIIVTPDSPPANHVTGNIHYFRHSASASAGCRPTARRGRPRAACSAPCPAVLLARGISSPARSSSRHPSLGMAS